VPIKVALSVVNRGGSKARITEGNITIKVDRTGAIQDRVQKRKVLLPSFDIRSGFPSYCKERATLVGKTINPAARQIAERTIPVSESIVDAGGIDFLTNPELKLDSVSISMYIFGYFKYRDWTRRSYVVGYCRRYVPANGKFVAVEEPDYEYAD
jgi:hypothetical protein